MAAPYADNGEQDEGIVYLYSGSAQGISAQPIWSFESNLANALLGSSSASAGDVNGDGFSDVIIGAPRGGSGMKGAAYLFLGSRNGLSAKPAWSMEGPQGGSQFGQSVASAGDINHDGYDDIIIGIPGRSNGQASEGSAVVYLGSSSGLSGVPAWQVESNVVLALFGYSVAAAGDVNGDGFGDVVIGALQQSKTATGEGQAYVYLGSSQGLATTAAWSVAGSIRWGQFGVSVSSAGDVNRDGFSDIIVGEHNYSDTQRKGGRVQLFLGSPTGPSATPNWSFAPQVSYQAQFGYSVASVGDINRDGYADVIIGARGYSATPVARTGGAFLFLGSAQGLSSCAQWIGTSDQPGSIFGVSVGGAGDTNGDGKGDLVVGSAYYSASQASSGAGMVFMGR